MSKDDKSSMEKINALRKALKEDRVNLNENYDYFLTGNPMLDAFVGSGGLPKYQLEYIWANSSVGKSTLAIQILASYIKQFYDDIVFFFDTEESVTEHRLRMLGIKYDENRHFIINPNTIEKCEEYINVARQTFPEKGIFVIWDTVCQTQSAEEEDGYNKIGMQAKSLTGFFRRVKFYSNKLTMFALNQHREQISSNMYAPKEPPGSNSIKHKSFVTLHGGAKKSELLDPEFGKCVTLETYKSKVISPKRKMVFEVTNVHGYDSILTFINYAKTVKILSVNRQRWKFHDNEDAKYTLDELYKFLATDESVKYWKEVIHAVYENLYSNDDEDFILEAKARIFDYYFADDKIDMNKFTSIDPRRIIDNDISLKTKDEKKVEDAFGKLMKEEKEKTTASKSKSKAK